MRPQRGHECLNLLGAVAQQHAVDERARRYAQRGVALCGGRRDPLEQVPGDSSEGWSDGDRDGEDLEPAHSLGQRRTVRAEFQCIPQYEFATKLNFISALVPLERPALAPRGATRGDRVHEEKAGTLLEAKPLLLRVPGPGVTGHWIRQPREKALRTDSCIDFQLAWHRGSKRLSFGLCSDESRCSLLDLYRQVDLVPGHKSAPMTRQHRPCRFTTAPGREDLKGARRGAGDERCGAVDSREDDSPMARCKLQRGLSPRGGTAGARPWWSHARVAGWHGIDGLRRDAEMIAATFGAVSGLDLGKRLSEFRWTQPPLW